MADNTKEYTYADIEHAFTPNDLLEYNKLCKQFIEYTNGKSNTELWHLSENDLNFNTILSKIHTLRHKYKFLKDSAPFFEVWTYLPHTNTYIKKEW
jgi:hypothetical protein